MKIAYIGIKGLPSKGGAERVVEAIVQRLVDRHEITVYCSSRYTPPDAQVPGVRLLRMPCLSGKYTHMPSVDLLAAFHAVLFGDFDVVHIHNIEAAFVIPLLKTRYKVIATAHGRTYTVEKWSPLARKALRLTEYPFVFLTDARTSVSQPHAEEWQQRYRRKVHYIPNGIEERSGIDEQAARALLCNGGMSRSEYILFAAGRIIPLKGCHLLIEAFRTLNSHLHLVIVGDLTQMPAYGQQLQQMAAEDDRIRLVPFVSFESQLMSILKGARLFVFPSTNEAMSMMLLEVASMRVPVVCSDIPENISVLADHALYFHSGSVDDLADKLQWALEHAEAMRGLGKAAQVWVQQNHSWDVIARQYEELYQQTLGGVA